jgi:hypothetical protein
VTADITCSELAGMPCPASGKGRHSGAGPHLQNLQSGCTWGVKHVRRNSTASCTVKTRPDRESQRTVPKHFRVKLCLKITNEVLADCLLVILSIGLPRRECN